MRYKVRFHVIAVCILIFFIHTHIIYGMQSDNMAHLMDTRSYMLEPANADRFLMQKKRSLPCDSCGNECASACGTKNFRTCCFNYLRKRNDPNAMKLITNKRLIDFILLQGRAMFTLNEHNREGDNGDAIVGIGANLDGSHMRGAVV